MICLYNCWFPSLLTWMTNTLDTHNAMAEWFLWPQLWVVDSIGLSNWDGLFILGIPARRGSQLGNQASMYMYGLLAWDPAGTGSCLRCTRLLTDFSEACFSLHLTVFGGVCMVEYAVFWVVAMAPLTQLASLKSAKTIYFPFLIFHFKSCWLSLFLEDSDFILVALWLEWCCDLENSDFPRSL